MSILNRKYGNFENYNLLSLDDSRRRDELAVKFYENGMIRSISFDKPSIISMKTGVFKAEKLIYYKDGDIKKIFPLDGKLSGYWTEEDEYNLAEALDIKTKEQIFTTKPIAIGFYKNQNVKNITLWPKERIDVKVEDLNILTRIGVSFYENGSVKSCEPAIPTIINSPIGKIIAYDPNAIGITGDINSLNFYEDGSVKSLITSENIIEVSDNSGKKIVYSPKFSRKFALDILIKETVKLEFKEYRIIINDIDEYDINNYSFYVKKYVGDILNLI